METLENILNGDFCTGCGICVGVANFKYSTKGEMIFSEDGKKIPIYSEEDKHILSEVVEEICPFSDKSMNEDEISHVKFEGKGLNKENYLGYVDDLYVGHVIDEKKRKASSGGGLLTAILVEMMDRGDIDYVIHTGASENNEEYFHYKISKSKMEVIGNTGSHYYPISLDKMIKEIEENNGKYVLVSIPCITKGFINACEKYNIRKPEYIFGLVCGHLKTNQFAEMIKVRMGVNSKIKRIHFRLTDELGRANEYRMGVELENGNLISKSVQNIPGSNWGESTFKLYGCDFCDDVYNECADITFGDAWLPKFVKDGRGSNIIVSRDVLLTKIINEMYDEKIIELEVISALEATTAQDATIRHRINALNYRIENLKKNGKWSPKKRVYNSTEIDDKTKSIIDLRMLLMEKSKVFFKENKRNILIYDIKMWSYRRKYLKHYIPPKYKYLPIEIYRMLQIIKSKLLRLKNCLF